MYVIFGIFFRIKNSQNNDSNNGFKVFLMPIRNSNREKKSDFIIFVSGVL